MDLDDALRQLYSASPDDFMACRRELTSRLRADGDVEAAQDIDKRRKPTLGAWVVNKLVLHDDTVLERITRLGDELRATQHALDAPKLRELSVDRRKLVAILSDEAFALVDREPAVGLRDDVRGTFDAAIADPDVAGRLGRLQRSEQFAGFGFGEGAGPPQLTLVRGGRTDDHPREPAPPARKQAKPTAAQRKHARILAAAREQLEHAGSRREETEELERHARERLREAEQQLDLAKRMLERARDELEEARADAKAARSAMREAHRTFDKLERETP